MRDIDFHVVSYCMSHLKDGFWPRKPGASPRDYVEYHITRRISDGLEGMECKQCKQWYPLVDFQRYRTHHDKKQYWRECRSCLRTRLNRNRYLRRIGEVFGKDSPEYLFVKNEKRCHYVKAVCKLLGILSDQGVPFQEKEQALRRVLPQLPCGGESQTVEAQIEKQVQEDLQGKKKGWRWPFDVEVR